MNNQEGNMINDTTELFEEVCNNNLKFSNYKNNQIKNRKLSIHQNKYE